MEIKKPTWYKYIPFRSRLEAKWAVFFDVLNVPYIYEPKDFDLPSGRYLPDFLLRPNTRYHFWQEWVEVKWGVPTPHEVRLIQELCLAENKPASIFYGPEVWSQSYKITRCVPTYKYVFNCLLCGESCEKTTRCADEVCGIADWPHNSEAVSLEFDYTGFEMYQTGLRQFDSLPLDPDEKITKYWQVDRVGRDGGHFDVPYTHCASRFTINQAFAFARAARFEYAHYNARHWMDTQPWDEATTIYYKFYPTLTIQEAQYITSLPKSSYVRRIRELGLQINNYLARSKNIYLELAELGIA